MGFDKKLKFFILKNDRATSFLAHAKKYNFHYFGNFFEKFKYLFFGGLLTSFKIYQN